MPVLNGRILRRVVVPHVPLVEQAGLAARLDSLDERIENEGAAATKLRLLKQGLMEDLLTGRVRVTNFLGEAAA